MINSQQLQSLVIDPVLDALKMNSASVRRLLMFTAATESQLGSYLKQYPTGPALGIYQMERKTYFDLWDSVLQYKPELSRKILNVCEYVTEPQAECLIWDLRFATVMARLQYWRWPEALPDESDTDGLIAYYYKYWGPNPDHTTVEQAKERITNILGEL